MIFLMLRILNIFFVGKNFGLRVAYFALISILTPDIVLESFITFGGVAAILGQKGHFKKVQIFNVKDP